MDPQEQPHPGDRGGEIEREIESVVTVPDAAAAPESDGLLSRVALIEQQPLAERAEAFTTLYEQLRTALDRADAPSAGAGSAAAGAGASASAGAGPSAAGAGVRPAGGHG